MILDQQLQIIFCSAPYMLDKKKQNIQLLLRFLELSLWFKYVI